MCGLRSRMGSVHGGGGGGGGSGGGDGSGDGGGKSTAGSNSPAAASPHHAHPPHLAACAWHAATGSRCFGVSHHHSHASVGGRGGEGGVGGGEPRSDAAIAAIVNSPIGCSGDDGARPAASRTAYATTTSIRSRPHTPTSSAFPTISAHVLLFVPSSAR